jgi:ABC-2 type transport system ATP-binding protein
MVSPDKKIVRAVDDISFKVEKGEIVGFLGPNGAGKSTTIKMMSGILVPDGGRITVGGVMPYKERKKNAKRIGAVFGQKTQLWWNLPVTDSFDLLKTIYQVSDDAYKKKLDIFADLLEVNKYMSTPVRQLSLGQRMRVEIAASLLHDPDILYLDEPTIGLDTIAKERIREFILEINKLSGITVILTTHDMQDVKELCQRLVLINQGKIIVDDYLEKVMSEYDTDATLEVRFEDDPGEVRLPEGARIAKADRLNRVIIFDKRKASALNMLSELSQTARIADFSLRGTEIEEVIKRLYNGE